MRKQILLLGLFFLVLFFSACNKVETNLHHVWRLESMLADEQTEDTWHFKEDGTLIRVINSGEYIDTAYFTIEKKPLFTQIKIIESDFFFLEPDVNGFFRVMDITEDKLILTRYEFLDETTDAAYLRREFIRMD
jgi:hypothetical protein